jgi:endonuclease G, mitochondrial
LRISNSGGGKLWRALENHVLRNAVAERSHVCCFTGPVFDEQADIPWRGMVVPLRFWKVVVWSEQQELRSLEIIAD